MTHYDLTGDEGSYSVEVVPTDGGYMVTVGEDKYLIVLWPGAAPGELTADISGKPSPVALSDVGMSKVEFVLDGRRFVFRRPVAATRAPPPPAAGAPSQDGVIGAPMPGKVIGALVKTGEKVKKGDPLVILESMKMEVAVRSDRDAEVREILAKEGSSVKRGQGLVRLVPS